MTYHMENPHHQPELTFLRSSRNSDPLIKEVDFFSSANSPSNNHNINNNNDTSNDDHHHHHHQQQHHQDQDGSSTLLIDDHPVNTGLNLTCASAGMSRPTNSEKPQTEMIKLEGELRRVQEENSMLKTTLDQISRSYSQLQAQLFIALQNQKPLQNVEENRMVSGQKLMDPRACTKVDANDASVSNDKTDREVCPDPHASEDRSSSQSWVPSSSKSPKTEEEAKSGEHVVADQLPFRKARVSVRARSEATMISDGCQWRKYGQKMAKGNPCPRAYYRCTMAVGCSVRKQVQRCVEDKTVLITTYEGNHNHPLPPAATAMANTTSAAASMLLSGSTHSKESLTTSAGSYFSSMPYASMATLSASAPFPTITLDLTQNPNTNINNTIQQQLHHPRYFPLPFQHAAAPGGGPHLLGQPLFFSQKMLHNSAMPLVQLGQRNNPSVVETVSAAIVSDPNFTAALAGAISSIIGRGGNNINNVISNNGSGAVLPGSPQLPQSCTTFSTN